jgi:hypothetical protein
MTLSARELSLLSNTDVLGYIQAQNAARDAQAKAEGWSFWTNMAEAIASDFANVYELELSFARGTYADAHKDAWGIKGYSNPEHTLEQVEAEIEELSEMAAEEYKAEQEWLEEQKQMERDQIALGLTDSMSCGEKVQLEEWEVYEAKAEEVGY